MTNHTPGPWTVDKSIDAVVGADDSVVVYFEYHDYANANLIAAAPALLEALELLVELCEEGGKRTCISARAAITKAKGERV